MKKKITTNIFVYGTLRKGFGNNRLLKDSRFVGDAVTVRRYGMYASGIPYVHEDEAFCTVVGEVYEVDIDTLLKLDRLEGHPNFYRRKTVDVCLATGNSIRADIYFHQGGVGDHMHKVVNGDYKYQEKEEIEKVSTPTVWEPKIWTSKSYVSPVKKSLLAAFRARVFN